jgi:ABC-type Fe3+ transport system permease subunit
VATADFKGPLTAAHVADSRLIHAQDAYVTRPGIGWSATTLRPPPLPTTLRKAVLPVAVPAVFTAAILSFILAWNDFAFAVSFLTSPNHFTAPLAITTYGQSQHQTFYNLIGAAVVIISIPIALLVLFAQRRIVSGLTAGNPPKQPFRPPSRRARQAGRLRPLG